MCGTPGCPGGFWCPEAFEDAEDVAPTPQPRRTDMAADHDLLLSLFVLALGTDGAVLPDDDSGDPIIDEAFRRGFVRTSRDFADEYTTVVTEHGREFARATVAAAMEQARPSDEEQSS